jgi:small subunit ribosomal protein S9
MMADEENPETPETPAAGAQGPAEGDAGHAVPSEEAAEIAGSIEDAPLEATQEAQESPEEHPAPEPATVEPGGEGHAAPSEDALEIAGVAEDAPLEAVQEAEGAAAGESSDAPAEESPAQPVAEEEPAPEEDEEEEEPAPRVKPSVPGAHLEVDIVPEGVDPLGRDEGYVDPYATDDDAEQQGDGGGDEREEEVLSEPISTAAIDLASGARYRATGKRKTAIARVTLRPGSGSYLVNGRALEDHFPRITLQRNIRQPLEAVGYQERMDVVARLHGGGISAQAGALRHGVSRALLEADPNLRGELKRRGFLTRDSRAKERKKAGLKKARKRPQFSKR